MNKRYAIVRVDNKCPAYENINLCYEENTTCEDCKVNKNYGDTKEQLIKKVATALQICNKNRVEKCNQFYFVAKEIVEFLGVME